MSTGTVQAESFFANYSAYLPIAFEERPDMTIPWDKKGESYDLGCVRHLASMLTQQHVDFARVSNFVNEGFASQRLWGLKPDIEGYLKDMGMDTSRSPMIFPMFTPMLARMLGLLSQVDVYARAESISPQAESRREKYMNQIKAMSIAAQAGPMMQATYGAMGLSGDPSKDGVMAERMFRDDVVEALNDYMATIAKRLKVDQLKYEVGQNLSNGGVAAIHGYFYGEYPAVEPLSMEELILDPGSRRRDFSDSGFIGFRKQRDISDLMDIHHGKKDLLKQLQSRVNTDQGSSGNNWPWGRPVEWTIYYKDGRYVEKGFVETDNGLDLVVIGEIDPSTGKPRYTEADVVTPPDNKWTSHWTGKTDTRFETKLRYCSFLPREYNPSGKELNDGSKLGDVVLSHGECDWAESHSNQVEGVQFPIFRCAWMNAGGIPIAPLTAAQTPQRVMNIITTDIVHRLSKAGGRSPVIDKRAAAGQSVKKLALDLKEGNTIELDTIHAGSVSNAVGYVGEGLDKNIFLEFDLIDKLKGINESLTHLYDQNFGGQGSANELVGVKRLQWQQTSLAQHPYVDAIRIAYQELYDWLANAVRKRLMTTPAVMEQIIGEKAMKVFEILGDMSTEELKVEVKLSPDASTVRQAVDETVQTQWLPLQLVDTATAAEILGSSSVEQALEIMKRFNSDRAQAQAEQAEAQMMAAPLQAAQQREMELSQQEGDLYNKMMDIGMKSDQTNAKSEMPITSALADNLKIKDEPAVV